MGQHLFDIHPLPIKISGYASDSNNGIKGVLNPNFGPFSFELKKN